jgi:hypothetical protein
MGLADAPLIYGTPGTPQNPSAPNLGKLLEIVNGFGNAYKAIDAINQADRALYNVQQTVKYDTTKDMIILYGTNPIRFIGLAEKGEYLMYTPDTVLQPVTVQGLKGLPDISPYKNINIGVSECHAPKH